MKRNIRRMMIVLLGASTVLFSQGCLIGFVLTAEGSYSRPDGTTGRGSATLGGVIDTGSGTSTGSGTTNDDFTPDSSSDNYSAESSAPYGNGVSAWSGVQAGTWYVDGHAFGGYVSETRDAYGRPVIIDQWFNY